MISYFFNQDGDLCRIDTEDGIVHVINIDTKSITKIKRDFYIDNEGNLFYIIPVGNDFASIKVLSERKFVDILNFNDDIFLVSDDYHLFIIDEYGHTCPKIIKFSDKVFPGKIKYIHRCMRISNIVLIYHQNSVNIFNVKHNHCEYTLRFIMKINNVTDVIFDNQNFTVCIKNKCYKISYGSVEDSYILLFMMTFAVSYIILYILTLSWVTKYISCSETISILESALIISAVFSITKLKFEVILSCITSINRWILSWFVTCLCSNKMDCDPKNITSFDDDIIEIALNDGTVLYGNLVPIIRPGKSARFRV